MRPASIVVVAGSVGAVSAGLIWPHLAGSFLRIFVTIGALSIMATSVVRARLPRTLVSAQYSPFDGQAQPRPPADTLGGVRKLRSILRAADDPEDAARAPIPDVVRRILAAHAARRLAEGHGLRLNTPSDHDRIRDLLSDPTWTLVRPSAERGPSPVMSNPIPQARLEAIMDELEQL